jgi:hypothetical protein
MLYAIVICATVVFLTTFWSYTERFAGPGVVRNACFTAIAATAAWCGVIALLLFVLKGWAVSCQ